VTEDEECRRNYRDYLFEAIGKESRDPPADSGGQRGVRPQLGVRPTLLTKWKTNRQGLTPDPGEIPGGANRQGLTPN